MRSRLRALVAVSILLIVVLIFLGAKPRNDFPAGTPGVEIEFIISDGEIGSSIAAQLQKSGVIRDAKKFIAIFTSDPAAQGISPGSHSVETHIPASQAVLQLLDPKRINNILVVREGSTLSDVIATLQLNDHISKKRSGFARVKSLYPQESTSLEGSLFPAQYTYEPNTTTATALEAMVTKAKEETLKIGMNLGFEKFTPFQVLTIASMVQVEGDPKSYRKVARVIYNRLAIGMALQLNSTVQYASNLRGQITLSKRATQIDSPFNTYRRVGLPPHPISNPGLSAISASLKPASGDWLYFITVAPGDTRFTKDFLEFSGWNTEFNRNVAAGVFK
jgi:UPF0755 protein